MLCLSQQDTVGHQLDPGTVAGGGVETHLIADCLPQRFAQLLGNTGGHRACRQSPGLGVTDHTQASPTQLEQKLGQLGSLARTGFPRQHQHLMLTNQINNLFTLLTDRQLIIVSRHDTL